MPDASDHDPAPDPRTGSSAGAPSTTLRGQSRLALWILARSLRTRWVANLLAVVAVFIGVGLALLVPMSASAFERGAVDASRIFDLLVTSEGSATQAVLNAIYYQERPLGNMDYRVYEALANEPGTVRAVPLGFGDSFEGHPVVGTTPEYFELKPGPNAPPYFRFAAGGPFSGRYQAVLGSEVAALQGLGVGDTFAAAHGFEAGFEPDVHSHEYRVVGVLERTGDPADRAVFASIETIWQAHGQFAPEDGTVDAEHACIHLGPGVAGEAIEASASGFEAPTLARQHLRYDAALVADGGSYRGIVDVAVDARTTYALFASREASFVLSDATGERVAPELIAGPDDILGCLDADAAHLFYLAPGSYRLAIEAAPDAEISLLLEEVDVNPSGTRGWREPAGGELADGSANRGGDAGENDRADDAAVVASGGGGPDAGVTLRDLTEPPPEGAFDNRGVTAVLWAPASLNDVYRVAAYLDQNVPGVQAIFPGAQIERLTLAIGQGRDIYGLLANVILVLAVITVGLNTYANALQAQRDRAILRAVGVGRATLAASVLLEATLLAATGVLLGAAAAWGGTLLVGQVVAERTSIGFGAPELTSGDWLRAVVLLPVAVAFAALPALRAARRSPLEQLA